MAFPIEALLNVDRYAAEKKAAQPTWGNVIGEAVGMGVGMYGKAKYNQRIQKREREEKLADEERKRQQDIEGEKRKASQDIYLSMLKEGANGKLLFNRETKKQASTLEMAKVADALANHDYSVIESFDWRFPEKEGKKLAPLRDKTMNTQTGEYSDAPFTYEATEGTAPRVNRFSPTSISAGSKERQPTFSEKKLKEQALASITRRYWVDTKGNATPITTQEEAVEVIGSLGADPDEPEIAAAIQKLPTQEEFGGLNRKRPFNWWGVGKNAYQLQIETDLAASKGFNRNPQGGKAPVMAQSQMPPSVSAQQYDPQIEKLISDNMAAYGKSREEVIAALTAKGYLK